MTWCCRVIESCLGCRVSVRWSRRGVNVSRQPRAAVWTESCRE
ncbi:hypothetical protein GBAR_LOCUS16273, partial [Geodia barretti]